MAARAESRDGRYRRPGSYRDVSSRARGPWPDWPSRGTGAVGARAIIRTSARLRGRGRLLRERSRSVAGLAMPPSCVPQGRTQQSPRRGRAFSSRSSAAQAAAPRREETAQALGRGTGAEGARGVAPQACRLLACGKAGKVPAKLVAWTRFFLSIRRGHSRRPKARRDSPGTGPRTGRQGRNQRILVALCSFFCYDGFAWNTMREPARKR